MARSRAAFIASTANDTADSNVATVSRRSASAPMASSFDCIGPPCDIARARRSRADIFAAPRLSSKTARSRGPDWISDYLQSFYLDPSRPLGVNNSVLPGASMPHVLWELQGLQTKVEHHAAEGHGEAAAEHGEAKPFELVQPLPIATVGLAVGVKGEPVGLDDQASDRPREVDPRHETRLVHDDVLRHGVQIGVNEDQPEHRLEHRAASRVDQPPHRPYLGGPPAAAGQQA